MPSLNTGSIVGIVYSGISPFPTNISGILTSIVDNQRFFINQFTGDSIGSVIAEKYQSALTDLSTANVLKLMAVQDLGIQSVSVGDVTTNNSNLIEMAKMFEDRGILMLKSLSKGAKIFKARG